MSYSRYSDIDFVEKGVRFISKWDCVLAVPVEKYKSFKEIVMWQSEEKNKPLIQRLLEFNHPYKRVLFLADIEKGFLKEEQCMQASLMRSLPHPEDEFETYIQCPFCGFLTYGMYYRGPAVQKEQKVMSYFYSEENWCLSSWCPKHQGPYQFRKVGEKS